MTKKRIGDSVGIVVVDVVGTIVVMFVEATVGRKVVAMVGKGVGEDVVTLVGSNVVALDGAVVGVEVDTIVPMVGDVEGVEVPFNESVGTGDSASASKTIDSISDSNAA